MKRIFFSIAFLLILASLGRTEDLPPENFSEAIEDNSFLVEEAYNQDAGVVQHIFNFIYFPTTPKDLFLFFTQEWPLGSQTHQLSYMIPAAFLDGDGNGIGDFTLNYRYQVFDESDWAALAPRFSVIFPTGSISKNIGFGSPGVQINIPVSKRWTDQFITHFNVGTTLLPKAESILPSGVTAQKFLSFANVGLSLGWLAHPHFNFLLEYITNFSSEIDPTGQVQRYNQYIVNPLVRGAINVGKLQIVPGIGAPLTWTDGDFEPAVFFYLSFEHPFHSSPSP